MLLEFWNTTIYRKVVADNGAVDLWCSQFTASRMTSAYERKSGYLRLELAKKH
jgi:hypothetical protein